MAVIFIRHIHVSLTSELDSLMVVSGGGTPTPYSSGEHVISDWVILSFLISSQQSFPIQPVLVSAKFRLLYGRFLSPRKSIAMA